MVLVVATAMRRIVHCSRRRGRGNATKSLVHHRAIVVDIGLIVASHLHRSFRRHHQTIASLRQAGGHLEICIDERLTRIVADAVDVVVIWLWRCKQSIKQLVKR